MKSKTCVITASGRRVCGTRVATTRPSGAPSKYSKSARISAIALSKFRRPTLETSKSGNDFFTTAVWVAEDALNVAYRAGALSVLGGLDSSVRIPAAAAAAIARRDLGFPTLETRMSDSLDFREVSVWGVKSALEAAYDLGRTYGKSERS